MTKKEYLRRAAQIWQEWSNRYAERIEADPRDSNPHDPGGDSDYALHHDVVSAPAHFDDLLNEKLAALTAEYRGGR